MSICQRSTEEGGKSSRDVQSESPSLRGVRWGRSRTSSERKGAENCARSEQRAGGIGVRERTCRSPKTLQRQWERVRLSRQSLRDLSYWRSVTRGEGRDLHLKPPDLKLHSDAANVG
jgi:hypothetical protein